MSPLLSIPYVEDATLDEQDRYTTFKHPEQLLASPGLNCSGFLIASARKLWGYQGSLKAATRDRLKDSGPGARAGQDWDFAWDLILNLSEGLKRSVLPGNEPVSKSGSTGKTLRGFALEDDEAWKATLALMKPDCAYLCSLSRTTKTGNILHYHAALILKDNRGKIWFYHTLPQGHSHRLAIDSEAGLKHLQTIFGEGKKILILEIHPSSNHN